MDSVNETAAQTVVLSKEDDGFMKNLESNCYSVIEKIRYCDEQTVAWQDRKQELQKELKDMMDRIQQELGMEEVSTPRSKETTTELIRSYLKTHGQARTTDLRKYLLSKGKKTNPGVALGKMVKDKAIENVERGLYKLTV